jgi:hypothetical protein
VIVTYSVVPFFMKVFRDFDAELPAFTMLFVVNTHDPAMRHMELAIPMVIMLVVIDGMVFALLHANPRHRSWAKVWSVSITILLVGMVLATFIALFLPLVAVV